MGSQRFEIRVAPENGTQKPTYSADTLDEAKRKADMLAKVIKGRAVIREFADRQLTAIHLRTAAGVFTTFHLS